MDKTHIYILKHNVSLIKLMDLSYVSSGVLFCSSFTVVVDLSQPMTCLHFHTLIYSKYDIVE